MKKYLLLIALMLFPLLSFAGHGKDGGWPQSIQLLKIAKQNLLDLLAQSSDQDVVDAINGMKDRNESIRVEDVNLETVTRLVKLVEITDVEQLEKSKYDGVRLFFYEDSQPEALRVYATKNFYNNSRYQVNVSDISASLLKEVQTLILHEISHLWGFGEENESMNYARIFAVRMVNILHGSLKINFTQKEKMASLNKAYFFETFDIMEKNAEKILEGKNYQCLTINKDGDVKSNLYLTFNQFSHNPGGYPFNGKDESNMRWTPEGYLMVETTYLSIGQDPSHSLFMKKRGASRVAVDYTICHTDAKKMNDINDRFIRQYYTRSNLLTDYENASLVVYQSLLIQDINYLADAFKAFNQVAVANQEQLIQNVDFKIKIQHKEVYDRLTSRKYKYSKDKDTKDMEILNGLVNDGVSTSNRASWAQVSEKVQSLNSQIINMKNYSRQLQMDRFFKDFMKEFNAIADRTQEYEDSIKYNNFSCGKHKRVGDFYACQIELGKTEAQGRIQLYSKMMVDLDAVVKQFTAKANGLKD